MRLLAVLSLGGCSPASLLNATISRSGLVVTHDVAYGPDPRQKLDVYRPEGDARLPVIVFFYGGSWKTGSKATYPFVAATLARRGHVVVVPDYRLYPQVQFPAFLQDCARATAWVQGHLGQIGGDPGRVFLAGHSAGAYNAVMLALNPQYLADAGTSRDRLAGAIGLAGPYDFKPMNDADVKTVFAPVGDAPAGQVITFASHDSPPVLLLAGDADDTVKPRNTRALAARLRAVGAPVVDKFYPAVGHIGLVLAIAPLFQGKAPTLADIDAFVAARPPTALN
jgi:acetyl esterase/lipase